MAMILESEGVEDVIDLNEKYLCSALGLEDPNELATLQKIELRVDTQQHNLQVTGELLPNLDKLKLNDSIVRCFRDIGTSFRNIQILHIARCEIREVQGIQAFDELRELYISFNELDELFDISMLENLEVLDFEGNNISKKEELQYLFRLRKLTDINFKMNPIADSEDYYDVIQKGCPNIEVLDDEDIISVDAFYGAKKSL